MRPAFRNVARHLPALIFIGIVITAGSCGGDDPQGPPSDVTAPTVASVTPANATRSVATTAAVTAQFSEAMAPATLTATSFTLRLGTSVIAGSVTLGAGGRTATFTPAAALANGTDITATIKGGAAGAADVAGNPLASDFTWTFRVNDLPLGSAGADLDVTRGSASVTLAGSATDADGQSVTYTWTQISGPPVGALTGATPSFTAPDDVATIELELVVSDGVDQSAPDRVVVWVLDDAAKSVWVSPAGNDANAGTRAAPKQSIQNAIDAAFASGADVYVAAGTYTSTATVAMRQGVGVYGGFHATTFLRDHAANETAITGSPVAVQAVSAHGASLDGFTIQSVSGAGAGQSSMGVLVSGSTDVVIRRNRITSGNGMAGAEGVIDLPPANGGRGADRVGGTSGLGVTGGVGGTGGGFPGGSGGNGSPTLLGDLSCSLTAPTAGGPGGGPSGAAGGAVGSSLQGGEDGRDGGSGANGSNGSPAGRSFGQFSTATYVPSNGSDGEDGKSGSGGGGGGGADCVFVSLSVGANPGVGGGGGGGGGAGRPGSTGGTGGGGSFGISLLNGSLRATILGNVITTGAGGAGGAGADAAAGGFGGQPGSGSCPILSTGCVPGGDGGRGGNGGWSGAGAGGGGGPTIGVLEDASSSSNLTAADLAGNIVTLGDAGLGGAGGVGANATTAASGADGLRAALEKRP